MIENKRALPLNRLDGPESALNIKQDNNSLVCESQPVEKHACILRRIDSIQATLARMTAILNNEPEQKVRS